MKLKKLICLLTAGVITVSTFAGIVTASDYYEGTINYEKAPEIQIGSFSYILKKDVEYESTKVPYSATVTEIPNIQKVEIPEKISYNGIEFTVTDIDLNGKYTVTRNKKSVTKNKYKKIEEIVLPDTVYNITEFAYFPNIKRMNIPENTVIGREDYTDDGYHNIMYYENYFFNEKFLYFVECPNIKLYVDKNNPHYIYKNDMLYSIDEKDLYMSFNHSTDIIIPNGTECLMNNGGFGFKHINSIKLPDSLESIWGEVFRDSKITKINFPNSLKYIEYGAFTGSNLKTVSFSESCDCIGERVFKNCNNLKSVTVPKNIYIIYSSAFQGCKNLKKVKISANNAIICSRAFAGCKNLKSVTINNAKEICANAFDNSGKLSKIIIKNKKKAPEIYSNSQKILTPKKYLNFIVKNKKVAKGLKKQIIKSKIKKARIMIGKKVIYKISK